MIRNILLASFRLESDTKKAKILFERWLKNNERSKNRFDKISNSVSPLLRSNIFPQGQEIASSTNVVKYNVEECNKRIGLLKNYNFEHSDCEKIIYNNPSLLKIPINNFEYALKEWEKNISNFDSFQYVIVNQPLFLSVEIQEIKRRILYFKGLCKAHKTMINFFIECPNIFFDDWSSIYPKVEYLLKQKRVVRNQLFQSKALSKSLDFIELRITLLEKCGVYETKIIYPHKKTNNQKHSNPPLNDIVDTDDETFSTKIAGITLEEYLTYNELFQMGYIKTCEDENDDSSDSDD